MERITVVKIGGNVIDSPEATARFVEAFAALEGPKLLVHGGGKLATRLAAQLGIESRMVDGRRITDRETLDVVTMVYAGLINKRLVAALSAAGCRAIGLSGADGDAVTSVRRAAGAVDYGYVGDIAEGGVNVELLRTLLDAGLTPVFSAITCDGRGTLLNTNADSVASAVAVAASRIAPTQLVFCFEKAGVLRDVGRTERHRRNHARHLRRAACRRGDQRGDAAQDRRGVARRRQRRGERGHQAGRGAARRGRHDDPGLTKRLRRRLWRD